MVATPYIEKQIRNYKTGKNKIRDKKEKRDKARRTMYLRHCCVGGKNMVGITTSLSPKRIRQANKPTERKSVTGQKGPFHGNMCSDRHIFTLDIIVFFCSFIHFIFG